MKQTEKCELSLTSEEENLDRPGEKVPGGKVPGGKVPDGPVKRAQSTSLKANRRSCLETNVGNGKQKAP